MNLRSVMPAESAGTAVDAQGGRRETLLTIVAALLALFIVASIAVLMGMA
jgi:hypothetical protein